MQHLSLKVITGAIFLASVIGEAEAGQCTQEIANYEKQLSSSDAGMGPTDPSASTTATTETPATATMNEAAEGKATSAQDVQQQNQGEPTAADAAQAQSALPAAGPAQGTLDQARQLDKAGKEAECMTVMESLKAQ